MECLLLLLLLLSLLLVFDGLSLAAWRSLDSLRSFSLEFCSRRCHQRCSVCVCVRELNFRFTREMNYDIEQPKKPIACCRTIEIEHTYTDCVKKTVRPGSWTAQLYVCAERCLATRPVCLRELRRTLGDHCALGRAQKSPPPHYLFPASERAKQTRHSRAGEPVAKLSLLLLLLLLLLLILLSLLLLLSHDCQYSGNMTAPRV